MNIKQSMWTTSLLVAAALLVASLAQARTLPDVQGKQVLALLDDSLWIGDGPASDRHAYVIFSTACGWCRTLHAGSRDRDDGVQLRWLLLEGIGNGAEYVAEQGTMAAVARAFEGQAPAPQSRDQALARLNVNAWVQQSIPGTLAFPTFVYQGAAGVEVAVGMRSDLSAVLDKVEPRPGAADHVSASLTTLARGVPTLAEASIRQFVNFGQDALPMHVLPSVATPRIGEVGHMGLYEEILGFVGDEWIAVVGLRLGDGRAVPAYIHAPQAVHLARLRFDVQPASGPLTVEGAARPIHSHPSRRSPVLDQLLPGYQLERVGEVVLEGETWDVVVLFQDGGRAYVPR